MEKPHYYGHRQRLRNRFLKGGLDSLPDYEAVELLLTLAIPRKDVKLPAKLAIERFGSFHAVLDASLEELEQIPGIGKVAPVALRIIREAANRYLKQKSHNSFSLANQDTLFDYCRSALGVLPNEVFKVFYLDSGLRVLGDEILEEGTIDRATVYPRRVMDAAIRKQAAALLFAHNHPNGDVTPSDHDKTVTRALILAAETLQIKIVDHIIVSAEKIFSFRKEGLL